MMSEEKILKLITSHVPDKGRILEIGCKSGDVVRVIAKETENIVYGINHSESAISEAKRHARHLRDTFFDVQKAEGHELCKYANFYTLEEVEEMLEKEGFKILKYSATLSQEPQTVRRVEEPSSDVDERGFICIKAAKNKKQNQ